ncbi:MAG: Type 1 glutamine amidotransferase-like domain-containing protein [Bdellovibrionales bacterium]
MKRQIFTMGGGGFLEEPENPLLDTFFIGLANKSKPKVCFVGTASGDAASFHDKFYQAMSKYPVEASHLSLFKPPAGSLRDYVLSKDVVYVGGGNTRNLMVLWREWGLDVILREAYEKGIVLGGISAGSLCWYEQGVTDSITGQLTKLDCLGFLKGSNCPHYYEEPGRRPAYQKLIAEGLKPGLGCDDGVAGYFVNGDLVECVSSRPDMMAYKVSLQAGKIVETSIKPRYLGAKS